MTGDPSEAFARLGDATRMEILDALAAVDEGCVRRVTRGFTDLFEATDAETTAGFSYHLRQLRDEYVEEVEDGYRLTYAGLAVVRETAAGTFTERFDHDPISVPDPCPFCEGALVATGEDNVLTVACDDCDRDVLALPFPPGGHATHDDEALLDAFDRHHRHRVQVFREGSCPECGGATDRAVEMSDERPRATFECTACGDGLRCPVALTVLEHPAVVSLYHEHGEDVRDHPVWNVGPEWTETVLSEEPVCVRVGVRVGEDHLAVLVGEDCSVVHTERTTVDPQESEAADPTAA
ncbi:DUF7351 domain-containing protein [Halorarius halobius]|uniref:DUF7351 domain-containing protein n=1 Tax=Halorarius halobius TaxID=2962671 RepID=UPI0020CFCC81|nr:ArsR family transcriptional regulator [Halorarius halobius]